MERLAECLVHLLFGRWQWIGGKQRGSTRRDVVGGTRDGKMGPRGQDIHGTDVSSSLPVLRVLLFGLRQRGALGRGRPAAGCREWSSKSNSSIKKSMQSRSCLISLSREWLPMFLLGRYIFDHCLSKVLTAVTCFHGFDLCHHFLSKVR